VAQEVVTYGENGIVGGGLGVGDGNTPCAFRIASCAMKAQVPHFNYVGDSIRISEAALEGGVILSNVKLDHLRKFSVVAAETDTIPTGN